MGIDVRKTPSLEQIKEEIPQKVWKHIQRLRRSGQHHLVHPYIQKVLMEKNIPCLSRYLQERERLRTFEGSVITTHRYLLSMDVKRLKEFDAVIIDEDIIFKSVIPNQGEITVDELKKLSAKTANSQLFRRIKKLLKLAKVQSYIKLEGFEYDKENEDDGISGIDIPSFCLAEHFYFRQASKEKNLRKDTFSFLKPAIFFEDVKYIMVSATADETICRRYFNEIPVEFYECKQARYMGILNQYPGKSMSRTCVANDPGVIRRLMKHFHIDEQKVITFMREKIGSLHFGNTEGSNTLEGQDILVVGTPYHADFLYKLAAFSMGLNFDEDEEVGSQIVIHNGYRFRFTTFQNEELRSIQFWMLESELEQAVGRARLLRNSCDVHLFSNFPLSQAQMVMNFDYGTDQNPLIL